jgi:hypothetical protein
MTYFVGEKEKGGGVSLPPSPDLAVGPRGTFGILTSHHPADLLGTEPHNSNSEAVLVANRVCTSRLHSGSFLHTLAALLRTRCGLSIQ